MSNRPDHRTTQPTARALSRRKLLGLSVLSAAASPSLLRAARATAQTGGAQPTVTKTPTGELKNPAELKAPKTKASVPTTISFWQYVGFHVDVQKFIAEEYKKRHDPNLSLEITAYPGLNEQRVAVKSAFAAQSATPDIVAIEPGAYAVDVYTSGSVLDFTKVFAEDPEYKRGFWPNALELLTINGAIVSVPAVTNTVIVYYNRGIFQQHGLEVPSTLDELKKIGAALSAKGIMPIAYPAGQDRNFPIFPYYTYVGGIKADKLMREADLGLKPWTSAELVAGAEFVEMMAKSGLYAKGPLGIKEPDAIQIFATGKSAMFWGGQWMRRSIRAALPPNFDLAIFPFPAVVPGGHKPVLSSVGITLTVNSRSKHPDLAFEMIKAITGPWGKIEYTKNLGLSPNGPISADAIAYQMQSLKDPLYPEFLKLQPTGTTRVIFTPAVEEAMTQGMQAIITGQKTPKAVMESVEAASQKVGPRKFRDGLRRDPLTAAARGRWRRNLAGYAFAGPALLVLAAFLVYPIAYSVSLSLHEWDGYTPRWGPFVGLENYRALLADEVFWRATVNSVVFVAVRTPLEVGLGFLLALLLNRRLALRSLLRTFFFVPVVMSLIVVTIVFQRVFEPNTGLLNTFLRVVGLGDWAHPWLGDPATALPAVIAVSVWKNVGFSLVILLAGLQSLPQDVLEAARVDGANAWQLTLRVITPLMRPILALTALLSIIGGLKVFDLVFIMTRGGPTYSTEVLATLLYREAFELNHMGVASAVAVILVALVLSIARLPTFVLDQSPEGGRA